MRAVRYHDAGDPSVLQLEEIEKPTADAGEVLVEMRAASINPVDAKFRAWGIPDGVKTTGSDVAGVVTALGEGVTDYDIGDRVFATGLHTTRFEGGSFADFVAIPTDLLASLPENVSFEDGAAAALVGVTAWRAFVDHAAVEPGETVVVHGGNGGVGHIAIGLANAMGASAVGTARPEHHDAVRRFGATAVFDYEDDALAETLIDSIGSADVVLDHIPEIYGELDVEIAAHRGEIVWIAGDETSLPNVSDGRSKEVSIHMMSMSNLSTHSDMRDIGPILSKLGRLLSDGRLGVAIDRTLPLSEAAEAHRAVMEDSVVGKIVVTP